MSSSICGRCSFTFSLFKRKHHCAVCRLSFCTSCFKKGLKLQERNVKHCLKCHAFSSRPFKAPELMLLSIKELKTFLQQNNIASVGCKEKRDLVDVIMNHQRPIHPYSNSSSTSQSSSGSQSQNGTSSTFESFANLSTSPSSTNSDSVFTVSEDLLGFVNRVLGNPEVRNETNNTSSTDNASSLHTVYVLSEDGIAEVESEEIGFPTTANQNQDHSSPTAVPLDDCDNASEIKKLSVKELKAVLDENFVDYKGCCEKDELIHRVAMLWEAKKSTENATCENMANGESDTCKVCMDKMVDCVLLECGHMMTCVECGKKLRECPMCRQNISRIVRVFKS